MIKSLKLHTDQTNFQSLTKVAVMSMNELRLRLYEIVWDIELLSLLSLPWSP